MARGGVARGFTLASDVAARTTDTVLGQGTPCPVTQRLEETSTAPAPCRDAKFRVSTDPPPAWAAAPAARDPKSVPSCASVVLLSACAVRRRWVRSIAPPHREPRTRCRGDACRRPQPNASKNRQPRPHRVETRNFASLQIHHPHGRPPLSRTRPRIRALRRIRCSHAWVSSQRHPFVYSCDIRGRHAGQTTHLRARANHPGGHGRPRLRPRYRRFV